MYSTISSKTILIKEKRVEERNLAGTSADQRYANLQICHASVATTRVHQGVQPWVLQQPLASGVVLCPFCVLCS
jgi:hypothetical protein